MRILVTGAAGFIGSNLVKTIFARVSDAQVVGIELYDLNGRRINKASKGLYIVRKIMDNGTIRTEKILK